MKGFALTEKPSLDVLSAYSAPQLMIDAVAATPGWNVIGAFHLPATIALRLELIGCVSVAGRTMRTRLFDLTTNAPVSGTEASITSTVDVRAQSPVFELTGNRTYQVQVEVTGGATGFGVARVTAPTV